MARLRRRVACGGRGRFVVGPRLQLRMPCVDATAPLVVWCGGVEALSTAGIWLAVLRDDGLRSDLVAPSLSPAPACQALQKKKKNDLRLPPPVADDGVPPLFHLFDEPSSTRRSLMSLKDGPFRPPVHGQTTGKTFLCSANSRCFFASLHPDYGHPTIPGYLRSCATHTEYRETKLRRSRRDPPGKSRDPTRRAAGVSENRPL
ncbi:hypothetical protein QBC47DRAFT_178333 [Echria macrotheca]|uniref:Uncharacterized protein n=1 Tax=Echria macrotheca TaxID=438768 RepID=A0AAJ0BFS5_9PEZI|nr:hypothetical protein QBC47DRAFT_178333 [Echria macrotheca]